MKSSLSSPSPLVLRLFGPFRLERDGVPITPPHYHRARALLAFLAAEDGHHKREFLADLLWPMEDAMAGRENLRRMLFLLKGLLKECPLETTRNEVCLPRSAAWKVDVADFLGASATLEEMTQCLGNYRGHFMQGFSLDASPAFEQWMENRRTEYQSRFVALGLRLADLLERSGGPAPALAHIRRMVLTAPWAEALWQCLIRLLVKNGRQEEARNELSQCRAVLLDELGVEPSRDTLALLESGAAAPSGLRPPISQERRKITVLYCELSVPGEEDPDILAERLGEPTRRCEQVLHEAGGHTCASPGGGLLGYFGYPSAREGDARRAVGAALACRGINGNGVRTRIGLHSGIVLSQAGRGNPDTAGLVTGLAIRVREAAGPGEAFMSESTRRLVAHACLDEARGKVRDSLSGREIEVFALLESAAGRPRWAGDSPLVGRENELAALEQARQAASSSGKGCLVLVSGEAGSGKTRLLREFAARGAAAGLPAPLVFGCLPELSDKYFHPFLAWLPEALEWPARDALARCLAALGLPETATPVVASLLGMDNRDEAVFRSWAAGKWQKLAVSALTALMRRATASGVPVFIEDLHWSDHSSREFCASLAAALPGRLVVATARPDFDPSWSAGEAMRIELPLLGHEESLALARAATAGNSLDAQSLERVATVSAGIPLFIEEVAREMATSGGLLPLALHGILQARVDTAGHALPTLRLSSSMGATVNTAQLALVEERTQEEVARTLDSLTEMGLLQRLGPGRFGFRHALLREAAYQSQSRAAKAASHRKIAQALIRHNPHAPEQDPELFAWHFTQAGEVEHAIRCQATAGNRAVARSLYREAHAHYQAALDLVCTLPEGSVRDQLEMELRLGSGIPLLALHGNGSREAGDNFRRTLALAEPMGDDPRLFPAYWGLWLGSSSLEDFCASRVLGEKLVRLARLADAPNWLSHAHYALGNTLFCLGQFAAATDELEKGVAAYRPKTANFELGEDPLVTNLSFLSWAHWFSGRHEDALAASRRAVATARELDHPYTLGFALIFAAILHRLRREVDLVEEAGEEVLDIAHRFGIALWQAAGTVILGWARVARGDSAGMNDIFSAVTMMGPMMGGVEAMFLAHLVDASHLAGMPDTGLEAVERGLAVAEQRKDWHYVAEFQRMKGEFMATKGADPAEVEKWFEQAARTAARHASPSLALRAAMSRARPRIAAGEPDLAQEMLSGALAAFQDGSDTGDVREARILLAALV